MPYFVKVARQAGTRKSAVSVIATIGIPSNEVWIGFHEEADPEEILHGARAALRALRRLVSENIKQDDLMAFGGSASWPEV